MDVPNKTTIEFNDVAATELERIAEILGAASKAEVIRNSLSLYSFIADQLYGETSRELAIVENGQIKKTIAVPGLIGARSIARLEPARARG